MKLEDQDIVFICQDKKHKKSLIDMAIALGVPISLPDPPSVPYREDPYLGLAYWGPGRANNYGEGLMTINDNNLSNHWKLLTDPRQYVKLMEEYADRRHTRTDTAYYTKAEIDELESIIGPPGRSYNDEVLRKFFQAIVRDGKAFKQID